MNNTLGNRFMTRFFSKTKRSAGSATNLAQGWLNTEYIIKNIKANDEELKHFLFTLGCYEGEAVSVISVLGENYVISIKDSRYSIDKDLAEAIII